MARPEKNNVDYFPHDCTHGKGMFYIRQKHGNDGYTVWFMLLEQLGLADRHYLDLSDDIQLLFLSSEFLVSKEKLIEIIEDLVKIKAIDQELWESFRVVYNQKFVDSIKEAYKKRTNVCTEKEGLLLLLQGKRDFNRVSAPVNPVKVTSNTQSKVNKSKENNNKEIFNVFRSAYLGTKKGLDVEFENFIRKNQNYEEILHLLLPALEKEIEVREYRKSKGLFVAEWKHLSTWINQKCWTQEFEAIPKEPEKPKQKNFYILQEHDDYLKELGYEKYLEFMKSKGVTPMLNAQGDEV